MPFLIEPRTFMDDDISWEDVWPEEKLNNDYTLLGKMHGQTPAISGPVPYKLVGGRLSRDGGLPDIVPGRWSGDMIVSGRVKDVICELDQVSHHFIPLELDVKETVHKGTHFLVVIADCPDAIIEAKSEVKPKIINERFRYFTAPGDPKITFKKDAIEGRAIWVDKNLRRRFFVSDALMEQLRKWKSERFTTVPAFEG
jgi:hypothetical protein